MLFAMTARMMPRAVLAERSEGDGASSPSEARAMVRPRRAKRGRWSTGENRKPGRGPRRGQMRGDEARPTETWPGHVAGRARSEERRVGKECRWGWSRDH